MTEPSTVPTPTGTPVALPRAWVPRQHGAWAMLAVPFLLGIAATRLEPWHLVLAGAATFGYLASATAQAWVRAARRERWTVPLAVHLGAAVLLGGAVAAAYPGLLATLAILVPAGAVTIASARFGRARGLVAGLAQVASAMTLLPAAAWIGGSAPTDPDVARASFVCAAYLVGTMLAVRSVIREQGNALFAGVSVAFAAAAAVAGATFLPVPYAVVLFALAFRAAALPVAQRWLVRGGAALRPIQVGIVEIVLSLAVVVIAFAVPVGG
jgi:hypothetical protein